MKKTTWPICSPALRFTLAAGLWLSAAACSPTDDHILTVTATAYNATRDQTSGNPNIAAWGDSLEHGMKAIAVSLDLLEHGLTPGTRVEIEGLPGEYVVRDKMDDRWTKRIDIFMGDDVERAETWGKRTVQIRWEKKMP